MGTRYDRRSIAADNLSLYSQAALTLRPFLAEQVARMGASRGRRFARQSTRLPVPVISLGNITFGGTGKTPVTLSIARWLKNQGYKAGIIASAHQGSKRAQGMLVSDGAHVFADVAQVGEEALLLAYALRDIAIPVAAGARREHVARDLLLTQGVDVLVLDDGYQYRSLQRDYDLCLIDATNPFGAGGVEEFGFLREPPESLVRASAILLTKANLIPLLELPSHGTVVHRDWVLEKLATYAPKVPVYELPVADVSVDRAHLPKDADDEPGIPPRLLPVSALGNPESFEATCRLAGLTFTDPIRYDDHARYNAGDCVWWTEIAQGNGYSGLVVTSKDWVKLHPLRLSLGVPVYVLTMRLDLPDWGALLKLPSKNA